MNNKEELSKRKNKILEELREIEKEESKIENDYDYESETYKNINKITNSDYKKLYSFLASENISKKEYNKILVELEIDSFYGLFNPEEDICGLTFDELNIYTSFNYNIWKYNVKVKTECPFKEELIRSIEQSLENIISDTESALFTESPKEYKKQIEFIEEKINNIKSEFVEYGKKYNINEKILFDFMSNATGNIEKDKKQFIIKGIK